MEKQLISILKEQLKELNLTDFPIEVEIPREESFGDLSTPLAMRLAKILKKSPKLIAIDIQKSLSEKASHIFDSIEIAGQGFINFRFKNQFLISELFNLLANKRDYLVENIGMNKRVQIEFVSANPTGPLHLGHGRGAAVGMALCN
ncbi:MAG: arginine--tRNA ligase, partial [Thermodesulfovibrionales bacterium]|nr:arginine--tRNA ligase [Thermodesulfovibrionales bacterium]